MHTLSWIRFHNRRYQSGQAMTEFQICAAWVLVPLFLMVPLLTKYIDIKHATISAARYQAWEYTAWHNAADDHDILTNYSASSVPFKTPLQTTRETERRFYSQIREGDNAIPIRGNDVSGWDPLDRNPLWTGHNGKPLFNPANVSTLTSTISTGNETPGFSIFGFDTGSIVSAVMNILDLVFDAIGLLMSFIPGSAGAEFSAINTEGYNKATVRAPFVIYQNGVDAFAAPTTGTMTAQAGVLSEGWSSGGTQHTYNQVGGAVPTTLFKELLTMPGLNVVWDVISFMAPELTRCKPLFHSPMVGEDGSLWLGYVDSDTVHPDRLSGGGIHVCDDAGICRLEPNIPISHSECVE